MSTTGNNIARIAQLQQAQVEFAQPLSCSYSNSDNNPNATTFSFSSLPPSVFTIPNDSPNNNPSSSGNNLMTTSSTIPASGSSVPMISTPRPASLRGTMTTNTTNNNLITHSSTSNPFGRAHTFLPSTLSILFSEHFVNSLIPKSLFKHYHRQRLAPPTSTPTTTTTTTTTTNKTNNQHEPSNKLLSGLKSKSTYLTEEERIQERNRKGRERSLRTRRRNALRLKMLEDNVVYLKTENTLLKDVVHHLTAASSKHDQFALQHQLQHDIVMAFTALLLCASSKPAPYIPPLPTPSSRTTTNNTANNSVVVRQSTTMASLMDQNNDQSVGDDVVDSQVVVKQEELVLNQHVHEQQQQQSIDHQPEKQQAQREPSQQQSKQSVAVQTTMSTDMMDDFELSSEAIGLAPPLDVDELDRLLRGDFD